MIYLSTGDRSVLDRYTDITTSGVRTEWTTVRRTADTSLQPVEILSNHIGLSMLLPNTSIRTKYMCTILRHS